jgi:glycosyltransferase involved in cell wall biosynthesis
MKKELKIALVHDFLVQYGGAEKVLEVLTEMFPTATVYTLLYDWEKMRGKFERKDIRTSYLQKLPKCIRRHYQWLLPFFPVMPETFDLREYDLVISSSGAWSKGIVTKLNTVHVAYTHSPMRFVWDYSGKYLSEFSIFNFQFSKFLARLFLSYIRVWDRLAAERPDYLIANSKYTQSRIQKYYRRNSALIYPPAYDENKDLNFQFPISNFQTNPNDKKYFLIVSRLSPYKKVDLAVEAFNKLGLPLVVVGEGKQKKYLKKIAEENIKIVGWKKKNKLDQIYQNARAFIFPANDDFGITAVEAMSFGLPVIAYNKGGVKEIVEEGKSGIFFDSQTPEVLADGVRRFMENEDKFEAETIKRSAEKFSKEKFKKEFSEFIEKINF